MKRGTLAFFTAFTMALAFGACGDSNNPTTTSNLTAPTASGPPPSAPGLNFPPMNESLKDLQPEVLINNASGGNGARTYTFEFARDSGFNDIALVDSSVEEGLGGETRWRLSEPLMESTKYFWRVKATASGVDGPYSPNGEFSVREAFIRNRPTGDLVVFDPLTGGSSIGEVVGGQFLDNGWQALSNSDYIRYQIPTMEEGILEFQTTNLSEPNPMPGKRMLVIMWDPTKGPYTENPFRMHLQKMDRNTVNRWDVRLRWISRGQEANEGISFFDFEPDIIYDWRIEWGSYPGITAQQAKVFLDGFQILVRNYDPIYHPKTHWVELGGAPRGETLEQAIWSNVRIGER